MGNLGMLSSGGKVSVVSVLVTANNTTGSAPHGMGRIPTIIGRPNPNKSDGLDAIGSANGTNVIITCQQPVSTDTVFSQAVT